MKIETFLNECRIIFKNKYDYSLVQYVNNKTPIKIICPNHGIFYKSPSNHKNHKQGCPECTKIKLSEINRKNIINLIIDFNKIHKNKYDYTHINYINERSKINIKCPHHGFFYQTPSNHIKGAGCPLCNGGVNFTINDFIKKSQKIHRNRYDYSLVEYKNNKSRVRIICPEHGIFIKEARHHLSGGGCNICKSSKGEIQIKNWLDSNNIFYIQQYKFPNCKYKRSLPFDFYLPDYNTCIEYNGIQHYEKNKFFKDFDSLIIRDNIKKEYCTNNSINLLIIKYNENPESILSYGGFNTIQIKKDVKEDNNTNNEETTTDKDLLKG